MNAFDIDLLKEAFEKSWSKKTSYPPTKDKWNKNNPAFGQCAVTSLVINDMFGGKIVYNEDYHHFWNILDDGTEIDLTRKQFGDNVVIKNYESSDRKYILESPAAHEAKTPERYELLKNKVEKLLLVEAGKQ